MTTYDLGVTWAVKAATLVSTRVYLTYTNLAAEVAAFSRIGRSSLKLATDINRAAFRSRLHGYVVLHRYSINSIDVKVFP